MTNKKESQSQTEPMSPDDCIIKYVGTTRKEVEERVINEWLGWGLDVIMTQSEKNKLIASALKASNTTKKDFLCMGVHNWCVEHFQEMNKEDLLQLSKMNPIFNERLKEFENLSDFEALDFPMMLEVHIKFDLDDQKQQALLDYLKRMNLHMVEL